MMQQMCDTPPFRHGFTDSIFLAYPSQVLPALAVEDELERNGFELIPPKKNHSHRIGLGGHDGVNGNGLW
jgi:hypothetical protein